MKNLFLIDGASGTGKSDLLRYVREYHDHGSAQVVTKLTTREQRGYEKEFEVELDLRFCNDEEFERDAPDYRYTYSNHKYGFSKATLNHHLANSDNVFVIVRNRHLIERLKTDYSFINVVPVYIYTDADKLKIRLNEQEGYSEEQVAFRLKRNDRAFDDYLKHPEIYHEIIINTSSRRDFESLIDLMIREHSVSQSVDHNLILVLMSFNPDNPALTDYHAAMKRAVRNVSPSLNCLRIDELHGAHRISDTVRDHIRKCRLAIIDLTENKQNVFYELGFAQGLQKPLILTAHTKNERVFYSGEFNTTRYENASELEERLARDIRAMLTELA